jgi:hypothetical protein
MVGGCRLDVIGHNSGYGHAGVQATGSFYMYVGVNTTFSKHKYFDWTADMELLYSYGMWLQKSYYFFPAGKNWKFLKKNLD